MSKSGAKMVDATFAKLFTPLVFWYANVAFTIFAPYLLLVFTFLRRICKEQTWANPFFVKFFT